jgi:hypothetical protein
MVLRPRLKLAGLRTIVRQNWSRAPIASPPLRAVVCCPHCLNAGIARRNLKTGRKFSFGEWFGTIFSTIWEESRWEIPGLCHLPAGSGAAASTADPLAEERRRVEVERGRRQQAATRTTKRRWHPRHVGTGEARANQSLQRFVERCPHPGRGRAAAVPHPLHFWRRWHRRGFRRRAAEPAFGSN